MAIIIDGYNLLNAVGVSPHGPGRSALERARRGLLDFLAQLIAPAELPHTSVVFDAREAPPGLPRIQTHRGLVVRFAPRNEDADTLIEALILEDHTPKRLTVVSSDHRVQRAARRRKARAVDADVWFDEMLHARRQREAASDVPPAAEAPRPADDLSFWLQYFQLDATPPESLTAPLRADDTADPFPPGYADDLLEEDGPM